MMSSLQGGQQYWGVEEVNERLVLEAAGSAQQAEWEQGAEALLLRVGGSDTIVGSRFTPRVEGTAWWRDSAQPMLGIGGPQ